MNFLCVVRLDLYSRWKKDEVHLNNKNGFKLQGEVCSLVVTSEASTQDCLVGR